MQSVRPFSLLMTEIRVERYGRVEPRARSRRYRSSRWAHCRRSHSFAGQLAGLLHPSGELSLVELVALVDVEVAHFLLLGFDRGNRTQRRAAEESHLDVLREAMETEEPALALDAIEGRVPLHGLAHVGHVPHNERVEPAPDVALPARHRGDVRLHRGVAVGLCDLRIAA